MDEQLRQVIGDDAVLRDAIVAGRAAVREARACGSDDLGRALGYLGEACRIAGTTWGAPDAFAEANAALGEALATARAAGDAVRLAAALIRIGELWRCEGRWPKAIAALEEASEISRDRVHGRYADFALQHLGKAYWNAGRSRDAIAALEEALAMRRQAGNEVLMASTEEALRAARALVTRRPHEHPGRGDDRIDGDRAGGGACHHPAQAIATPLTVGLILWAQRRSHHVVGRPVLASTM
jgi:tetratricopeptide (TPR) repeat protein